MTFGNIFRQKVIGIEHVGFVAPNVPLTMERVNVEHEKRPLRYDLSRFYFEVFHGFSEDYWSNGCNSQRLFNDSLHILKLSKRLGCNFIVFSEHLVYLLDKPVLNVLMLRQK